MEKNRKRAQRRRDNARMLKRARKMVENWYVYSKDLPDDQELHIIARIFRDNMQRCSCCGCGNPRRGYMNGHRERLTMPERKAEDSYFDQLNEYMTVDPNEEQE